MLRAAALLLTALTGFSGLVYEVAWQKYLATLLGSHSEATAAVLAIFLGGLSVGYWVFGALTRRIVERAAQQGQAPRLLLVYGGLELGIGIYVLLFPWLFRGAQHLSYAIPHGPTGVGFLVDVALAALLIGPPSVLMGGTIPMLTQALSRSLEDATRFHAFVYAFNTFGAFVGALSAGFFLIPRVGLEPAMVGMGFINIAAGSLFMAMGLRRREVVSLSQEENGDEPAAGSRSIRPYAIVALLTGFAMMCLQTVLIRIGVFSFGSSQFTFSMVVAVFVLSIALGSFWVSSMSRIPRWLVVGNQWGIALLFALLYLRLDEAPYWVHIVRTAFRDSDFGFVGFHFLIFLLILPVVGLPVVLSGASLPLLFHHTRRQVGHLGDLAGTLYSWNTVGSLLGALLGGYALLYWLDLHEIYRLAVAALVLAGMILTVRLYGLSGRSYGVVLPLVAGLMLLAPWDPTLLHAGLSRKREAGPRLMEGARQYLEPYGGRFKNTQILYYRDDPTASVMVQEDTLPDGSRARGIYTDGKADGDTHGDYVTTGLMAVLPAVLAERAERAFVIGRGVGITAGELGGFESMQEVQIAEISGSVIEAAPLFDFATRQASLNPKIHTTHSDAYRALMRSQGEFDVIVAAPSQLWVAGVEMLYSREFLEAARDRLTPGGVYCQYLQHYETDEETLRMVMRTTAKVFEHTSVWHDANQTMMVLGFNDDRFALDLFRIEARANRPDFRATLERAGIAGFPQLLAHELFPLDVLDVADLPGPVHSLYHPRLNELASRAVFRGRYGRLPFTGFGQAAEVGAKNSLLRRYAARFRAGIPDETRAEVIIEACEALDSRCSALLAEWMREAPDSEAFRSTLERATALRRRSPPSAEAIDDLTHLFGSAAQPVRAPRDAARLSVHFEALYHHAAPFAPDALLGVWSACRDQPAADDACRGIASAGSASTGAGSGLSEAELDACFGGAGISRSCQDGLRLARTLLETGEREAGPLSSQARR